MPRRRTTRAGAAKRPIPTLPEDEGENILDEEQRKHKVETLIKDFKAEISSRIRDLKHSVTSLMNQIDLAYSLELMQIPMEVRTMKLSDYLQNGGAFQKSPAADTLSNEIQAIIGSHLEPVEEEKESQTATVKTTRQPRQKKVETCDTIQQTTRRTGRIRKVVCETPANRNIHMLAMATPLITPKFDPRLYQTPAVVTRAPKPGEAIMSMEGSPITNVGASNPSAGILVPIDSSRSMWLSDSCDLDSVDETTVEKAYKTIEEMKARLDSVLKNKTNVK